eukprot:jgi/Psemu1/47682/gm1.47682_g
MDTPDLKSLFPSFDLKLAHILHLTLDVPQEACNHICEALIIAGATTWNRFICVIYEYGYIVDLDGVEYQAQTDPRSTRVKDQHTLTTFVDFINDIIPQVGCYWYNHNQYTRDAFLAFCNVRNQHPELTAFHIEANAAIPLAPFHMLLLKFLWHHNPAYKLNVASQNQSYHGRHLRQRHLFLRRLQDRHHLQYLLP